MILELEPAFDTSQIRVTPVESCGNQRVKRNSQNILNCRFMQFPCPNLSPTLAEGLTPMAETRANLDCVHKHRAGLARSARPKRIHAAPRLANRVETTGTDSRDAAVAGDQVTK